MRARKQAKALLLSAAIILAAFCPALGQGIYVDHVDGLNEFDCIEEGGMVTFHMRVVGDETPHLMLNNGYTICSPEMTWGGITVDYTTMYPLDDWFDFVKVANIWGNGMHCDTIGTGLLALFGPGLPIGFDGILYTITVGPVSGGSAMGASMTLDSSWYPPSNPWMWDIVGENVDWGGPYTWTCNELPLLYTYCAPQPTILKQIDRILYIYIVGENPDDVVIESIRVQGNIPSYQPVSIEGDNIVVTVFIMRFLGASGFRPVTGDFEATYTVDYDKTDGSHVQLVGDFSLKVYPGDVTLDGQGNINDLIFAADYFWRGGGVPTMIDDSGKGWEVTELLDANGDGNIDPRDVIALKDILKL